MPPDTRKVSFRDDKSKSGSSRSSVLKSDSGAGSSSTASSHTAASFSDRYSSDPLYEVSALRQALAESVKDTDQWKARAQEVEQSLRKELGESNSRVKALTDHCSEIEDDKRRVQRELTHFKDEVKSLKAQVASLQNKNEELRQEAEELKKNDKLKKKAEKQPASPSSPETGNPHRSESKRPKDSNTEKEKARLKERFVPRNENPSETSSSKRSSSRAPRNRRMSNASHADRLAYVEPYGQVAPRPTVIIPPSKTGYSASPAYPDTLYPSTPRSALGDRPIAYQYHDAASPSTGYEDGNYHAHPLPPRR